MKIQRKGMFLALFFFCLYLTAGTAYAAEEASGEASDDRTIAPGVYIQEIDVGGMTVEEAQAAVENYINSLKSSELRISFNGDEDGLSLEDMGFAWNNPDVVTQAAELGNSGNVLERYKALSELAHENVTFPLEYTWEESALRDFLQTEAQERQTEAVEATIERDRKAKKFIITESVTGLTVDVASTMKAVKAAVENGWQGGDIVIDAVAEVVEPKFTTEMAESIQDILGEFQTKYNPGETDRSQNLKTASGYIDGVVLLPGESLSFFDYVYPITTARGYREATAYSGGRYVDSLGGGLCQVSTTCYNAVLLAELEVVTRSPHSMTVSYVEPGLDSGQAQSSNKNLSFANNTEYPVYVEAYADKGTLYIAMWGKETRPANRTVRYGSDVTREWIYAGQPPVVSGYDPNLPYGYQDTIQGEYPKATGHAYKEVLIDGKVVSKEYLSDTIDTYRATPRYVIEGTGGLSVEEYLAGVQPGEETQAQQPAETQAPTTAPTEAPTTAPTEPSAPSAEATAPTDPPAPSEQSSSDSGSSEPAG